MTSPICVAEGGERFDRAMTRAKEAGCAFLEFNRWLYYAADGSPVARHLTTAVDLEVIRPGESVTVGEGVPGTVVQVCVMAGGHVQYQVEWWDSRNRRVEWFDSFAVRERDACERQSIGFAVAPTEAACRRS